MVSPGDSSFLFIAEYHVIVWMYHSLFIHSPIEERLGYFQVLAVAYKTLMNILCSFCIDVSF